MGLTMRSINYKRDDAYFPYMRYLLIHDRIPNNHLLYKYIFFNSNTNMCTSNMLLGLLLFIQHHFYNVIVRLSKSQLRSYDPTYPKRVSRLFIT